MSCKALKKPPTHCPHIPMATNMHQHKAEKSSTYQSFNIHHLRLAWLHLHAFAAYFFPPRMKRREKRRRNVRESALKLPNGFDHVSKINQQLLSATVCCRTLPVPSENKSRWTLINMWMCAEKQLVSLRCLLTSWTSDLPPNGWKVA